MVWWRGVSWRGNEAKAFFLFSGDSSIVFFCLVVGPGGLNSGGIVVLRATRINGSFFLCLFSLLSVEKTKYLNITVSIIELVGAVDHL